MILKSDIKILQILVLIFFLISVMNCEQKSDYQKEINTALKSNIQKDSLILGYTFGMTRDDFFEYSWDINKQEIVVNGSGAEIVQDVDWLKSPARRSFYPNFLDDRIVQFPIEYSYNGWAPWNNQLISDSLLVDLKNQMETVYGGTYKQRVIENGDTVFYQIQGNREIRLEIVDRTKVRVIFTDLSKLTTGTH